VESVGCSSADLSAPRRYNGAAPFVTIVPPRASRSGRLTNNAFTARHLRCQLSIVSLLERSMPQAKVDKEIDGAELVIISEIG